MEKKKMKLGVKILIVVLILLGIFLLITFRKFLILRQIAIQEEEDRKSTNYYSKTYDILGEVTELWIYGEKKKLTYTSIDKEQLIQRTIYIDNKTREAWIINHSDGEKVATKIEYNEDLVLIPNAGIATGLPSSEDIWPLIQLSTLTSIDSTRWNDEKAYKISFNFFDSEEHIMWIDKEDYRVIGLMNGVSSDEDKNMYSDISTFTYTFNTLTENDVKLPDLTDYTIKDGNGNIIEE